MSYWQPPTSSGSPTPSSPMEQQQQHHRHHSTEQYRQYSAAQYSGDARLFDNALFPHDDQTHQHDAFAWQHHQHDVHQQQHHSMDNAAASSVDPRMLMLSSNLDPLPMQRTTSMELQRAGVSIEDEIFEARMLQEALRDCDATPATLVHSSDLDNRHQFHQHHQHSATSPAFHPQSFQAQLIYPTHFATVTPPGAALPRGSISQQYPSIHAVSPVENLRSYSLSSSQPLSGVSPSSYSSTSSTRSSITGLSSLQGSTPPASSSSGATTTTPTGQAQPKKRVQTARICHIEGCTRGIRSRGLCKAHGGGRRCTTPGCTTSDQGGGHCVLHGGGRRCRIEGCMKSAQWRGVCKLHGGARRCRYGNCTKNGQVKQGYCRLHYNLLTQQRLQGQLAVSGQAGPDGEEKQREYAEEKKGDVADCVSQP